MSEQPLSFYESAPHIHPRAAHGRFARLRVLAMLVLLGLFYLLPWIEYHGQPLLLFDLPARRFHVFGMLFVPQDLFLMTWLLVLAAMTLFLATAVAGRLWCGYACPQTVWTEAMLWIEQLIEGDAPKRYRLDRMPWGPKKLLRRGAKHLAWLLFALGTGYTFVAYFVPAPELVAQTLAGDLSGWALFWILFYGLATWGNAGFLREQVCKYMCPYARFQGAMFDPDTLIIAYDPKRGEPRKAEARKRGVPAGDCVSCQMCVQVCPTGIDIRDGLQYECIACAACIDACDAVMDAVEQPRGLIRYTSARAEAGQRTRLLRPRTLAYGGIWLALVVGFGVALWQRSPATLDVIHVRNPLYRTVDEATLENRYTLKLSSRSPRPTHWRLQVPAGYRVEPEAVELQPGQTIAVPARMLGPADGVPVERVWIRLVDAAGNAVAERETRFLRGGP